MRKNSGWWMAGVSVFVLSGCTPALMTSSVAARPGPGKTPADFAYDNQACNTQANQQLAAAKNESNSQVMTALLTTDAQTAAATQQANNVSLQQQIDIAYSACMYARGEFVPGYAVEEPLPQRRVVHRAPKPKDTTNTTAAFQEPPPSATPAAASGFAEPPAAKQ